MLLSIHKHLFIDVCACNYDLYKEFINMVRLEYVEIMSKMRNIRCIADARFYSHKLLGIVSNFSENEMIYLCRNLLLISKTDITIPLSTYQPYIDQIVLYDKTLLGL
jgi:hypothetical protein